MFSGKKVEDTLRMVIMDPQGEEEVVVVVVEEVVLVVPHLLLIGQGQKLTLIMDLDKPGYIITLV